MRTRPLSLWIVIGLLAVHGGAALVAVFQTAQPDQLSLQSGLLALPLALGLVSRQSWARLAALAYLGVSLVLGIGVTVLTLRQPETSVVHLFAHRVESERPAVIGLVAALALAQTSWMWWVLWRPRVRAVFQRRASPTESASSVHV